MMRLARIVCAACAGIPIASCEPTYSPPAVAYVYTTGTQSPHRLAGLQIKCEGSPEAAIQGAILLTKGRQDYYIDGRRVASMGISDRISTFIQLPPGDHELVVEQVAHGMATFGVESSAGRWTYAFTLDERQRGVFKCDYSRAGLKVNFENVEHWRELN